MTRWGLLLLVLFFVLGLGGVRSGKAVTLAVCLTALVMTYVMAGYVR
jgi:hypothetical protein